MDSWGIGSFFVGAAAVADAWSPPGSAFEGDFLMDS